MSDAIEAMICKWQRGHKLGRYFHRHRPSGKSGGNVDGLEVPSSHGSDEIRHAKEVEAGGEGKPAYTVKTRSVPGYLRPVNAKVWRGWSISALCYEDLGGVLKVHLLCRYGSMIRL